MRVLVLGASGMLGHKVLQVLSERFETYGTTRRPSEYLQTVAPAAAGLFEGASATELETVSAAVANARPDAVVNCIGIVKQVEAAKDPVSSIRVNSLFPHECAAICAAAGARLIHVSTD